MDFNVNLTASRQHDLSGEGTASCAEAEDDGAVGIGSFFCLACLDWSALQQAAVKVEDGQCAVLQSGTDDAAFFKSQSLLCSQRHGFRLTDAVDEILRRFGRCDGYLVEVGRLSVFAAIIDDVSAFLQLDIYGLYAHDETFRAVVVVADVEVVIEFVALVANLYVRPTRLFGKHVVERQGILAVALCLNAAEFQLRIVLNAALIVAARAMDIALPCAAGG